jgi:hypothetical protein
MPIQWSGVYSKIIENGASFGYNKKIDWLPGWSDISTTEKLSKKSDLDEAIFKSVVYRFHDVIHNIWIFPNIAIKDEHDAALYKKIQMAGEIATLAVTEFFWLSNLYYDISSDKYKEFIRKRNAQKIFGAKIKRMSIYSVAKHISLMAGEGSREGSFSGTICEDFASDYFRMLEEDRNMIDTNTFLIKKDGWSPSSQELYIPPEKDYESSEEAMIRRMLTYFMKLYKNPNFEHNKNLRRLNLERKSKMNQFPIGWSS